MIIIVNGREPTQTSAETGRVSWARVAGRRRARAASYYGRPINHRLVAPAAGRRLVVGLRRAGARGPRPAGPERAARQAERHLCAPRWRAAGRKRRRARCAGGRHSVKGRARPARLAPNATSGRWRAAGAPADRPRHSRGARAPDRSGDRLVGASRVFRRRGRPGTPQAR